MDIIKILSKLNNSDIDIGKVINNLVSILGNKAPTPHDHCDDKSQFFNNFTTKYPQNGSAMQGTMQCIVPNRTDISSQNSTKTDWNKFIELANLVLPLILQRQTSHPHATAQEISIENNKSQILELTKVPMD